MTQIMGVLIQRLGAGPEGSQQEGRRGNVEEKGIEDWMRGMKSLGR